MMQTWIPALDPPFHPGVLQEGDDTEYYKAVVN